jgi:hypothetical protein
MITIPTSELVGLFTDVLGFTPAVKSDPRYGVLIEWDGEALHTSAYDVLSAGRSTWIPGEGQEGDPRDGDEDERDFRWGGEDPAWRAFVSFDDIKAITTTFKVAAKLWWIPVSVKISPTGGRLTVERSGEFGKPVALITATVDLDTTARFPDVADAHEDMVQAWRNSDALVDAVAFSPYRLAAFGTVRSHGELLLRLVGQTGAVAVTMGTRFEGFIFPTGVRHAEAAAILNASGDQAGSDFLRHGTGVHVSPGTLTEPIDLPTRARGDDMDPSDEDDDNGSQFD